MLLLQNKKSLTSHYANIYLLLLFTFNISNNKNRKFSYINKWLFNYYMKLFTILIIDMLNIKRHYMYDIKSDMLWIYFINNFKYWNKYYN